MGSRALRPRTPEDRVEPGSTVYTDDAAAYAALPSVINQFKHDTVAHSASEYVRGEVHTNSIEVVWSVLKRSIAGTWHKAPAVLLFA